MAGKGQRLWRGDLEAAQRRQHARYSLSSVTAIARPEPYFILNEAPMHSPCPGACAFLTRTSLRMLYASQADSHGHLHPRQRSLQPR